MTGRSERAVEIVEIVERAVEIVELGWATTIQDLGRPGLAHLGVPPSGVIDRHLAGVVNRLVGNDESTPVLETAGGLVVRAAAALLVATTAELAPRALAAGEVLALPVDPRRTWSYLAVRGGFTPAPVLGSRAHDTLSGIGPQPLAAGSRVPVGDEPATPVVADLAPVRTGPEACRLWPGPRLDWFGGDPMAALVGSVWTVGTVNRVGMRLRGPALRRSVTAELASEGLVPGAIQVPPDGQPMVMLADHPTTGGYPVIAVVDPDDLGALAQHRGGSAVRFRPAR